MPRKNIVEKQSTWVPLTARVLCYHCGVGFKDDIDKNHCRMCGDIFCVDCWGSSVVQLSPEYGYGSIPQPVCVTCSLLLSSFPTFASRLHQQGGGQLLPPQYRVIVVADTRIPEADPDSGKNTPTGNANPTTQRSGSILSRLFGNNEEKKAQEESAALAKSRSGQRSPRGGGSSQVNVLPTQRFPLDPEKASPISLFGWRPMNPNTMLSCKGRDGSVSIPLRLIRSLEFQNNEKIVITVVDEVALEQAREQQQQQLEKQQQGGEKGAAKPANLSSSNYLAVVHLVAGTIEEDEEDVPTDPKTNKPRKQGNTVPAFTFDSGASFNLVSGLNGLLRHCKAHFAFSQAHLALHPDLCPGAPQ